MGPFAQSNARIYRQFVRIKEVNFEGRGCEGGLWAPNCPQLPVTTPIHLACEKKIIKSKCQEKRGRNGIMSRPLS